MEAESWQKTQICITIGIGRNFLNLTQKSNDSTLKCWKFFFGIRRKVSYDQHHTKEFNQGEITWEKKVKDISIGKAKRLPLPATRWLCRQCPACLFLSFLSNQAHKSSVGRLEVTLWGWPAWELQPSWWGSQDEGQSGSAVRARVGLGQTVGPLCGKRPLSVQGRVLTPKNWMEEVTYEDKESGFSLEKEVKRNGSGDQNKPLRLDQP